MKTPSTEAKAAGLKSLREVAKMTKVKERTLTNWFHDRKELFKIVLIGCAAEKGKEYEISQ